ncbi:unnamed protein product [Sphenostylis stenocarpa]|uniref:Uncharacterized protein n=1 Tax=Sphenostylis stenocarpa TaxID=92480 RepID=A0AA86W584_9FABA|nr:unnamed protein product [Sphenostylis stenocarpa]
MSHVKLDVWWSQNPNQRNSLYSQDAFAASSSPSASAEATQELLLHIPGVILNRVNKVYSIKLACGDFSVIRLQQGRNVVVMYARGSDPEGEKKDVVSYGSTMASKGQEGLLKDLDTVLGSCNCFSVQWVSEKAKKRGEALKGSPY